MAIRWEHIVIPTCWQNIVPLYSVVLLEFTNTRNISHRVGLDAIRNEIDLHKAIVAILRNSI